MSDTIAILVGRLNTGWLMCERESDPNRKAELEAYWTNLLREYERACDERSAPTDHYREAAA